jgi:hypothetical protein
MGDAGIERTLAPFQRLNFASIGRLAAAALARTPRVQGRGKFYPESASGPDAREYCALIVAVAWHKDSGQWPGPGNATAQLICEMLWRCAGGVPHAPHAGFDAPGTFATWRDHLRI